MHTHAVKVAILLDEKETFFASLSVDCQLSPLLVTSEEYTDLNGATTELLLLVASHLTREALDGPARYPHASRVNMGTPGRSEQEGTEPMKLEDVD